MNQVIYLDHAATTPVDALVLEAMLPYFSLKYGNPSSLYELGRESRQALSAAREKIAEILGVENPAEIIFTSGGSESNNLMVKGLALQRKAQGNHLITSRIEHSALRKAAKAMEKLGFSVTFLPVNHYGLVDPKELEKAITPQTSLISIMTANHEVGTIQPIKELAAIAQEHKIPFHTDAVQAAGNMEIKVKEMGVDALSLSAHKFYGPKGMGALYLRSGLKLFPLIHGGGQEGNLRAGTENVPGIVGMAKALELAERERDERNQKCLALRDKLINGILAQIPHTHLTGHPKLRLSNSASFIFEFIEGESILLALAAEGICVSSGSACSSASTAASQVLLAMGFAPEIARGSLRMTLGKDNTREEIEQVLTVLPQIIEKLRTISPLAKGN